MALWLGDRRLVEGAIRIAEIRPTCNLTYYRVTMDLLRWVIGVALLLPGAWLLLLNWIVFVNRHVRRKSESSSWIPLIAAILLSSGLFILPLDLGLWPILAFLVDWGSLPGLSYSIWRNLRKDESKR